MSDALQYLTEIVGSVDDIFADAEKDPKIAAKKAPTLDAVLLACVKVVERRAIAGAADLIRDDVQEMYDMYTLNNGDRADVPDEEDQLDAWDTGLDDQVEALLKPYGNVLSNDWLATFTIDSRLWEDGAIETFATAFGKEAYKQLCWNTGTPEQGGGKAKTPAQILSSAGILTSNVIGHFADRLSAAEGGSRSATAAPASAPPAAENADGIDAAMDKLYERIGIDYDVTEIQNELESVLDDDEILSMGAAGRIGLDEDDVNTIQMFGLNQGSETIRGLMAMLADRSLAAKDPKPPKASRKPRTDTEPKGPVLDPAVLVTLQEHGGTSATDLAVKMGVSRATYNNYVNGKSPFAPDATQYVALQTVLVAHRDALETALTMLDSFGNAQPEV